MSRDSTAADWDHRDRGRTLALLIRAGVNSKATAADLEAGTDLASALVDGTGNRFRKEAALSRAVGAARVRLKMATVAGPALFLAVSVWGTAHPSTAGALFFPLLGILWGFGVLFFRHHAAIARLDGWLAEVRADPGCQIRIPAPLFRDSLR